MGGRRLPLAPALSPEPVSWACRGSSASLVSDACPASRVSRPVAIGSAPHPIGHSPTGEIRVQFKASDVPPSRLHSAALQNRYQERAQLTVRNRGPISSATDAPARRDRPARRGLRLAVAGRGQRVGEHRDGVGGGLVRSSQYGDGGERGAGEDGTDLLESPSVGDRGEPDRSGDRRARAVLWCAIASSPSPAGLRTDTHPASAVG
jgi:hypothetical protein